MADQKREIPTPKVAGPKALDPIPADLDVPAGLDAADHGTADPTAPLAEQAVEGPERDRRGIALPRRHKVGGIITPQ
jgi:hypothetical protein